MIKEISASVALTKKPSNQVAAVADVNLHLGDAGTIKISGFRVMRPDGKPLWVAPPGRKGERLWFDTVRLSGAVKQAVETAILREYQRVTQVGARK